MMYVAHVSWVRRVIQYRDPAQPLITAGEQLDDLDHDLSDPRFANFRKLVVGRCI